MTEEVRRCYETLGLSPDAGEAEIKKAYFRLVRLHPPEKDPEQFQQIRHAYELLKEGPPAEEQSSFSPPEDPSVRYLLTHARRHAEAGNDKAAAGCFEEALTILPNDPFLLLNLAKLQQRAGNPRKSAKTAQQLAKLYPDYAEAYAFAAEGFFEGGWYKKALPEFQKAYDLGYRSLPFLSDYADAADANGFKQKADQLRRDLLQNTKWDSSNMEEALYLFSSRAEYCSKDQASLLAFLEEYSQFFQFYRRFLKSLGDVLVIPLMRASTTSPKMLASLPVYQKMDSLAESVGTFLDDNSMISSTALRTEIFLTALDHDKRVPKLDWHKFFLAALLSSDEEDPGLQRYALLDAFLCLLKNRDLNLSLIPVLKSDYPFCYSQCREYLDLLTADPEPVDAQIQKLKREYSRLSEQYEGGIYYKRYPEERPMPRGVLAYSDTVPFVRQTKKPGRNDPCPCGSGLKFKRCCLGKGIYD